MALTADRKFGFYPVRMRIPVTPPACRNQAMLFLMALYAGKLPVFCLVFCQDSIDSIMAGAAIRRRDILTIADDQGHMGLMAFSAACPVHIIRMW